MMKLRRTIEKKRADEW